MNRIITTLFCFSILIVLPAHAQNREYQPGVHYTTLAKPKAPAKEEAAPAQEAKPNLLTASTDSKAEPEPDSATRIWNKYKDLATGTAGEKEKAAENAKPDAPQKPDIPEKPSASLTSAQPPTEERAQNAFQSIIEGWKQTNENRRDMRSLSFETPDTKKQEATETP